VFNLLSNAIKFTPPGGHVHVSAQVKDSIVQVAVADTGPGIAEDERESIFEVFEQGRSGTVAARPEGSGLGLPLARSFVEARRPALGREHSGARHDVPLHVAHESGGVSRG
jgi:signal transduction histidine kinase